VSERYDSIVLGASIDGLAAACSLAAKGRSVLVLDPLESPGAAAGRIEFHPGFKTPGLFLDTAHTRRGLLSSLNLETRGLTWRTEEAPLHVPTGSEGTLELHADPERMATELSAKDHPGDADAYQKWSERLQRYAPILAELIDDAPPDPADQSLGEMLHLGMRALSVRRLGQQDMHELVRVAPLPAADWMNENFECEALKTGLTAPALFGSVLGPRAAGTAALMLLRSATRGSGPAGGPAALVDALVACLESSGGKLRLGVPPAALELGGDGVEGVVLEGGDRIDTKLVLSALDPKRTFLDLLGPASIDMDVEKIAMNWRMRGSHAVLLLALSEAPAFQRAISASSLVELEKTSDHLKYGRLAEPIWVQADVPSADDSSLAPEGSAVLVLVAHGIPHGLRGGWNAEADGALEASMLSALERIAPGCASRIVGKDLMNPLDIERRFGLGGGHPHAGELSLDQLWLQRPGLQLSRYATPIPGLFLGGSSSHPGGPFLAGAGILAARKALSR